MTDKEFIEMSRLLDSLTDGADTLRVVFETETVEDKDKAIRTGGEITTRVVSTERAKAHPDYKHRRTMPFDRDLETLASIIQKCDDWTTDKFKASEIYRRMRAFVSATSGMPVGISYPFKKVRSLCEKPMAIIPGKYPDLYPPFIRALLADELYQKAIDHKQISPPFTWNESIKELAGWLEDTLLLANPKRIIKTKDGPKCCISWEMADCVFLKDGEPITAKQLRTANKG